MIKSLIRPGVVLLLVAAITLPVAADKAKTLYEKAKDAEARQDYEQAFEYYKQAYDLKPRDLKYRAPYERTKFLAAASHVHRGQLLRDAGKWTRPWRSFRKPRSSIPRVSSPCRR